MPDFSVARHDESDVLFSTEPLWLAARFGERTKAQIRDGRDPFVAARLAATYAFMHRPDLRGEAPRGMFGTHLWDLSRGLNELYQDALKSVH